MFGFLRSRRLTIHENILVRGATGGFSIKVIGYIMAFICQIVIARHISVEEYGVYNYVFAWINILAVIGLMGFDRTSVKFVAKYISEHKYKLAKGFLTYSRKVVTMFSVFAALVFASGAYLMLSGEGLSKVAPFLIGCLIIPLWNFIGLLSARLRGLKKIIFSQMPGEIARPILVIIGLFAIKILGEMELNVVIVLIISMISMSVTVGILVLLGKVTTPKEVKTADPEFERSEWLDHAKALFLVASFGLVMGYTDKLMIGAFGDNEGVALYSCAMKYSLALGFILTAMNQILAPVVVSLYSEGNIDELRRVVRTGVQIVFYISVLFSVSLIAFGKSLLSLFGSEYVNGYNILIILVISKLLNSMAGPVGVLLSMTGHHKNAARILGLSAAFNVVANLFFVPLFGAFGAAIATCLTTILWNGLMTVEVWRRLNIVAVASPIKMKLR